MRTNTCMIKSVDSIENYLLYLLNEDKHKGQDIIDNDVLDKIELLQENAKQWKQQQESKQGHRPKPLSVVLSFPMGTTKEEFISISLEKIHLWIRKISAIDKLALDDNDIELFVKSIPYVAHYKESNPHVHFLVPKIFPNKKSNSDTYINLYKYKYSDPLYKISGWSTKQKVHHKQLEQKAKLSAKSSTLYLKDKLYDQIQHYEGLNAKLDKYIKLIKKDIDKGNTDKAIKKLQKVIKNNG
ncbi:hypothetical protein HOK00_07400 [bacterium]|jgi:hypothetical protein|nr:hypothetical protein [bacterium]